MPDATNLVERYIASFNETDPARRHGLITGLFTSDGGYTDPHVDLSGHAQIEEFVVTTQASFPGFRFSLGSPVDAHHAQARFTWHATAPEAAEPVRRFRCDRRRR